MKFYSCLKEKTKILCFLDYDSGRDVEILMPVIYFAEKYLNAKVDFAFIYDVHAIYRKKPDLVLIANTIGSWLHHLIAKYAFENNIKVFTLISEGNFPANRKINYYGYNTLNKFLQEYICLWSERTLRLMSKALPSEQKKMVVTGATGFDRYKIYKFPGKKEFLEKYRLGKYKKIIGYAGWSFGKLFNETGLMEIISAHKENAEARIKWMTEQMYLVEDILQQTIKNNTDTLFLLKRHPNEIHPHLTQRDKNEMINLSDYPNVLYIRDEEDVHTLISVSDIWLGFESTTVIETWLMKETPTIFINPDQDFIRDNNYKGTIIVHSDQELQNCINEYYNTGTIEEFNSPEKKENRAKIISDIIGFGDGLNHLRAGFYLKKTIKSIPLSEQKNIKLNVRFFIMYLLMNIGKYFYHKKIFLVLPKLKKTVWIFEKFRLKNIPVIKEKYFNFMDTFYIKHSIPDKIGNGAIWNEIIK